MSRRLHKPSIYISICFHVGYVYMHLLLDIEPVFYDLHKIFPIYENSASHRIQKDFITENYVRKRSYKNGSRKFRRVFHGVSVPSKSSMSASCHFLHIL